MKGRPSYGVAEAKKSLSELLGRVAFGREEIVLSMRGRPMARLVPVRRAGGRGRLGASPGWIEDEDPFFLDLRRILGDRRRHSIRAVPSSTEP